MGSPDKDSLTMAQIAAMSPKERFTHLCDKAHHRHIDEVKRLLAYEFEASADEMTDLLCREFLNKHTDIFELLVCDPRFQKTEGMLEFVISATRDPKIPALMFEQGFRIEDEMDSEIYWDIARNKKLDFIKLVEQYQPDLFAKHFKRINICAVWNPNPENLKYLVDHHLDKMDYPMVLRAAISGKNVENFKLLFSKMKEADDLALRAWEDVVDTREEAQDLRRLMANKDDGYGPDASNEDLYTIAGVLKSAFYHRSFDIAAIVLKMDPISPGIASSYLQDCLQYPYPEEGFYQLVELLLEQGADPNANVGRAIVYGAWGEARVLQLMQDKGAKLENYADELYREAVRISASPIVDFLNEQNIAAAVKKPELILQQVLKSMFNSDEETIDFFRSVVSEAVFHNDKIIYQSLIDNLGIETSQNMIEAMVDSIKEPYWDPDFIKDLLEYPLDLNGWVLLCNFMDRGLGFKGEGDVAGELLAKAIWVGNDRAIYSLLEEPELNVHVAGEGPLIQALWYPKDNLVDRLRDEHGARVSDINWHNWFAQLKKPGCKPEYETQARARLMPYLKAERQAARELIPNPEPLTGQPKKTWLTPVKGLNMRPLQALACRDDFLSLLKKAKSKTGLRFTADELLAVDNTGKSAFDRVVGYGYHKAFFDPLYWANHTDDMTRLFRALPAALQKEVGVNVLEQARINNGYQNRGPKLKFRRRPS